MQTFYTISKSRNVITTALNIAVQDGLMNFNPMDKVRKPRSHETPLKYITINEIKLLNDSETNHPIIKNAFLFSCFTGLRLSDIENLTWKQTSIQYSKCSKKRIFLSAEQRGRA